MPTDIKLDTATWDYDLSTNGLVLIEENSEVVAQRLRIALQTKQGEIFTDIVEGIPLLDFSANKDGGGFADSFMVNYIGNVEGVEDIISYSSTLDIATRVYNPVVVVRTTKGDIITIDGGDL